MPAVCFQTGYLTIRGYEERGHRRSYTLGFPNHEWRMGSMLGNVVIAELKAAAGV